MKKAYTRSWLLAASLLLSLSACKKDAKSTPILELSAADSNKTINVTTGEKILVTLKDPGDGGFSFDAWQFNTSVLKLSDHNRSSGIINAAVGDFGTDTWEFDVIGTGVSQMKISGSRGNESVSMFKTTIQVR